jgi:hypothetical protein
MHANNEDRGENTLESLRLEAEVEAWRKKRALRPLSTSGKVSVVRIRRRGRSASWSGPLAADRPLADASR